jgi:tetratricopeptide (TPR) repeat protein
MNRNMNVVFCWLVLLVNCLTYGESLEEWLMRTGERVNRFDKNFELLCKKITPKVWLKEVDDRNSNGYNCELLENKRYFFMEACKYHSCIEKVVIWYDLKSKKGMVVIINTSYNDNPPANALYTSTQMTKSEIPVEFTNRLNKWMLEEKFSIGSTLYEMFDSSAAGRIANSNQSDLQPVKKVYEEAFALYKSGRKDDAAQKLKERLGTGPYDITSANCVIYNDYGFFLEQTNQFKEAEEVLLQVVEHFPDRAVAWLNLGDAQKGAQKIENAKASYKRYIELMKKNGKGAKVLQRVKDFLE